MISTDRTHVIYPCEFQVIYDLPHIWTFRCYRFDNTGNLQPSCIAYVNCVFNFLGFLSRKVQIYLSHHVSQSVSFAKSCSGYRNFFAPIWDIREFYNSMNKSWTCSQIFSVCFANPFNRAECTSFDFCTITRIVEIDGVRIVWGSYAGQEMSTHPQHLI